MEKQLRQHETKASRIVELLFHKLFLNLSIREELDDPILQRLQGSDGDKE